MTWKGWGRPSGRSAIASPSSTAALGRAARTASTISGTRAVMSSSVRVNTLTSGPSRCTWTRMPSIFHSTAAGDIRSKAAAAAGRRGGQHRPQRPAHLQTEGPQCREGGRRRVVVGPRRSRGQRWPRTRPPSATAGSDPPSR